MKPKLKVAVVLEDVGKSFRYEWVCSHYRHKEMPITAAKACGSILSSFVCSKFHKRTEIYVQW